MDRFCLVLVQTVWLERAKTSVVLVASAQHDTLLWPDFTPGHSYGRGYGGLVAVGSRTRPWIWWKRVWCLSQQFWLYWPGVAASVPAKMVAMQKPLIVLSHNHFVDTTM